MFKICLKLNYLRSLFKKRPIAVTKTTVLKDKISKAFRFKKPYMVIFDKKPNSINNSIDRNKYIYLNPKELRSHTWNPFDPKRNDKLNK